MAGKSKKKEGYVIKVKDKSKKYRAEFCGR